MCEPTIHQPRPHSLDVHDLENHLSHTNKSRRSSSQNKEPSIDIRIPFTYALAGRIIHYATLPARFTGRKILEGLCRLSGDWTYRNPNALD